MKCYIWIWLPFATYKRRDKKADIHKKCCWRMIRKCCEMIDLMKLMQINKAVSVHSSSLQRAYMTIKHVKKTRQYETKWIKILYIADVSVSHQFWPYCKNTNHKYTHTNREKYTNWENCLSFVYIFWVSTTLFYVWISCWIFLSSTIPSLQFYVSLSFFSIQFCPMSYSLCRCGFSLFGKCDRTPENTCNSDYQCYVSCIFFSPYHRRWYLNWMSLMLMFGQAFENTTFNSSLSSSYYHQTIIIIFHHFHLDAFPTHSNCDRNDW